MVSSIWNLMLRCLRRGRTGESGPEGLGAGETATLFLPKILVLPLLGKLKLVARDPFGMVCPIAIFPFRLLNSTAQIDLHRIVEMVIQLVESRFKKFPTREGSSPQ